MPKRGHGDIIFPGFHISKQRRLLLPSSYCLFLTPAQGGPQSIPNSDFFSLRSMTWKMFGFCLVFYTMMNSLQRSCNPSSPEGKSNDWSEASPVHEAAVPSETFSNFFRWMEILGWPEGKPSAKEERTVEAGFVGDCLGASCPWILASSSR